jgi:hypothetical protein
MKNVNVTFSIPPETQKDLQMLVGRKKMSAFVTKLINAALEEKKAELRQAYIEASHDPIRSELFQEWSSADTEDWEW